MMGPKNLRRASDGTLYIPRSDAETEAWMDERYQRITGELRWLPKKNIFQKAKSLAVAVTSGKTTDETFEARMDICKGCKCLRTLGDNLYCGCCGCGKNRLAELHTKLKMKKARCPLNKW